MTIPVITLDEIHAGAAKLGLRLDDDDRVAVLLERDTTDVWACPGSGKTTLLVAKLYLLCRHWSMPHRGICALSHTNVAKEEITSQLAETAARKLLLAPHFVDTIQRFVHEFLAIPALTQKFGVRPRQVMSGEQLGSELMKLLQQPQYAATRQWLGRQSNPESILANVRFSGATLDIVVPKLKNPESVSYKSITDLKLALVGRGMFTYRDMYSLGAWYVAQYPSIKDILAYRFPLVFFDETQDTDSEQWDLLRSIFEGRSVIQRFGDHNQAIYQSLNAEGDGCGFPNPSHLSLNKSMRFSRSIASLVENLSINAGVALSGDKDRTDRAHAILLFRPENAELVLPKFAAHIEHEFPERNAHFRAHAVGAIGKSSSSEAFPTCIQHYWPAYDHRSGYSVHRPTCFAEYILLAQAETLESGSVRSGINYLCTAVVEVLGLESVQLGTRERLSAATLLETLRLTQPEHWKALSGACIEDNRDVKRELAIIGPVIVEIMGKRPVASLPFFKQAPVDVDELLARKSTVVRNRFHYEQGNTCIDIDVGTIHSVKGQSHDATLVLETRYHSYDLERCKPFLLGDRPKKLGIRDSDHLRRLYVGVTRPRELLVLAIQHGHLTESDRERLGDRGWTLLDVES
jgi:DNA helicase II / ATP-dependent DNA helicase PcrA